MVISEAERMKLSKLAKKETGILCRYLMLLDVMKLILYFAIAFEKKYNEKSNATCTVHITKDMVGSDFLTGISSRFTTDTPGLLR